MIRFGLPLALLLGSCSPPSHKHVVPGQIIVAGDITFTTREENSIAVSVVRKSGEQHATGAAVLHGMTVEEARTSALVGVAKGRAWLSLATTLSDAQAAYAAAMQGIAELGVEYRNVKKGGRYIIDDTGQAILLARMNAEKGDHVRAVSAVVTVLRERLEIYRRVFSGSVE